MQQDTSSLTPCNGGIVIPYSAEVYGVAVSSRTLAARQRVIPPSSSLTHLSSSSSSVGASNPLCWSRVHYEQYIQQPVELTVDEGYTCETLDSDTCLEYTELTDTFRVGNVLFDHNLNHDYTPLITVPVIASGTVDAIAYWYELLYV